MCACACVCVGAAATQNNAVTLTHPTPPADPPASWRCRCGFTSASAITFRRHLSRLQAAEPGSHAVTAAPPPRSPQQRAPPPPLPPPLRERLLQQLALEPPTSHALDAEEGGRGGVVKREAMAAAGRPRALSTAVVTPDDIEHLLAWTHPSASAKALAGCLYGLVCVRAALYGSHFVQPVTLVAAVAGGALAAAAAAPYAAAARDAALNALHARGLAIGGASRRRGRQQRTTTPRALSDETVERRVTAALSALHAATTPTLAAIAVVATRRITGARGGVAGQFWLAVALYCLAAAAEARLVSNAALAGVALVASFAVAPATAALAGGADAVALEAVAAVRALVAADARSAALAAGTAGATLACVRVAWLPRAALAAVVAGGVLARGRA